MTESQRPQKRQRSQSPSPSDVQDDEEWATGDFTIVSSDHIRFRVDKYIVLGASKVFRDAEQVSTGPSGVELTDPITETAAVIRRFLQLIANGSVGEISTDSGSAIDFDSMEQTVALVSFLRKFDCPASLAVLRIAARGLVHRDALPAFVLAAHLNDDETCVASLKNGRAWAQEGDPDWHLYGLPDHNELLPGGMPFRLFRLIPSKYLFCLCRAWALSPELMRSANDECMPVAEAAENLLESINPE